MLSYCQVLFVRRYPKFPFKFFKPSTLLEKNILFFVVLYIFVYFYFLYLLKNIYNSKNKIILNFYLPNMCRLKKKKKS